MKTPYTTEDKV